MRIATYFIATIVLFAATQDAYAQRVRTYDQQATETYGTSGATVQTTPSGIQVRSLDQTTQEPARVQQEEATEDSDGEAEAEPTHVTTMSEARRTTTSVDLSEEELYRGVIPGTRDEVKHMDRARQQGASGPNQITWVGFQAKDDMGRVFFQTARHAEYSLTRSDNTVRVRFENMRIPTRNFSRFIDASYFGKNVQKIEARQVARNTVEVSITLREDEQPTVQRSGNYIYLDFMRGQTRRTTARQQ